MGTVESKGVEKPVDMSVERVVTATKSLKRVRVPYAGSVEPTFRPLMPAKVLTSQLKLGSHEVMVIGTPSCHVVALLHGQLPCALSVSFRKETKNKKVEEG
jgi:hypothetical protein